MTNPALLPSYYLNMCRGATKPLSLDPLSLKWHLEVSSKVLSADSYTQMRVAKLMSGIEPVCICSGLWTTVEEPSWMKEMYTHSRWRVLSYILTKEEKYCRKADLQIPTEFRASRPSLQIPTKFNDFFPLIVLKNNYREVVYELECFQKSKGKISKPDALFLYPIMLMVVFLVQRTSCFQRLFFTPFLIWSDPPTEVKPKIMDYMSKKPVVPAGELGDS